MLAWKVVGPSLEGGIFEPQIQRKLFFRAGDEVTDPAAAGFCVWLDREAAYQNARCNPDTRLVELSFADTSDGLGSEPSGPAPNTAWARLRHARVIRELEVDRSGISSEESRAGRWRTVEGVHDMPNRAAQLFERFAIDALSDPLHGVEHVRRVAQIGRSLARNTPGADLMVITVFAGLHDACRPNPDHGVRAAELARSLHPAGPLLLDEEQLETLCVALEGHADGLTTTEPTIGCSWDADRLDLPRCGIKVDPRFLSTAAAKAWIA